MGADLSQYKHLKGRPTPKELNMALWAHEKFWPWFPGAFIKLDMQGRDLSNKRFSRIPLEDCNCQDINLKGADMRYSYIAGCDFLGADLSNVNFYGCEIIDCNFTLANVEGANFAHTLLIRNRGLT